jgi:hypothetical protein
MAKMIVADKKYRTWFPLSAITACGAADVLATYLPRTIEPAPLAGVYPDSQQRFFG